MDQVKIGSYLKELRKEKHLTQQDLADKLHVSDRTVSRWETGRNMPDISILVELAEFYQVSIPEIIDGERKRDSMNEETRQTAMKLSEYSKHEIHAERNKIASALFSIFGIFIITSALAIFPSDSSWGSIYSIFGSIILLIGIAQHLRTILQKRSLRVMILCGLIAVLVAFFSLSDFVAVKEFGQVPRFCYEKDYGETADGEKEVVYKTLFFTAVQKNPGEKTESVTMN